MREREWSRRGFLTATAAAGCVSGLAEAGLGQAHDAHDGKRFDTLPILDLGALLPGDVLHLRVNSVFTSYHFVRPIIHAIQVRMLTSASRKPRSLYHGVLQEYRAAGLPADDPIPGRNDLADTVRDLTDTGHTTLYVGGGAILETTGEGCQLRALRDVDTARYVVARPRDRAFADLLVQCAQAFGGSRRSGETQRRLRELAPLLPPTDQAYLDRLCSIPCADDIEDRYDTVSGSRGFFGKLKDRHHIGHGTALDTMLYIDDRSDTPSLHRDTICSSFAAVSIQLAERATGWAAIGRTFDETRMTPEQRATYTDLREGVGVSTHVRPEWVLPSYLELGMKLSGRYETVGQFINVGAERNTERIRGDRLALARPHADYIEATAAFVDALTPAERARIQLPELAEPGHYEVIDEARLPHREDKARSAQIYDRLYAERQAR